MIVSIHQPGYLPWHGLFHRQALSDLHVFLDTVQFEKHGFNNRVKIKTAQGSQWLTVPVLVKGKFLHNPITEVMINTLEPWARKHWKTILLNYSKAPFFERYAPFFQEFYAREWVRLADLNTTMIRRLAGLLGVQCRFVKASELGVHSRKSDLVLGICQEVGAKTYLSGVKGREYLEVEKFRDAGIRVYIQRYRQPRYPQLFGEYEPYLSIIDLLFNCGDQALAIITEGQGDVESGGDPA